MKMVIMTYMARVFAAMLIAGALLLAGCVAPGSASAGASGLNIVTSVYPFQFVAERIGGARTTVLNLTQPGAEPHDLELTPKQVGSVSAADLIIYLKGFQPAVDQAVEQSGNNNALDVTTVVPLEATADGAHHQETEPDPHVWLDPTKLAVIATAVADRLAAADPAGAGEYRANADRLRAELGLLDQDFRSGLTGCQRTAFITSHAAFGYLANRYRLTQIAITGLSPDAEPSPARIAAIQREAGEYGVTTIFTETLASPAVAEAIAGDLGLRTDVLDPIEGLTPDSRGEHYLAVMRANLAALEKANGCPRA